ncbi:MAG: MTH1187 family thiamine-binding protein [Candidatus Bipolaricaulota bacterium]
MLAEFSVYPLGKSKGLSEEVAKAIRIVEDSGLDYEFTAMGTILEGDYDQIMETIKKCHHVIRKDHSRVETYIKIDDKVGQRGQLKHKTRAVREQVSEDPR